MNNLGNNKSIYFTIVSFLVLLIPAFYFIYWMYNFYVYANRYDAIANFKNALPEFIGSVEYYEITFIALAIIALLIGSKGLSNHNTFWHNLSLIITLASGLLAFIYLLLMIFKFFA